MSQTYKTVGPSVHRVRRAASTRSPAAGQTDEPEPILKRSHRAVSHAAAAAAAVAALGLGCNAVVAQTSASLPGQKQPIEHIAISGAMFKVADGTPGCYGGAGTVASAFPVPRGALLIGATAYVIDPFDDGKIGVELNRHDLVTGGTVRLATAFTQGASGHSTLELKPSQPVLLDGPHAVNITVRVGSVTCFKGAEVHFIRNGLAAVGATAQASDEPQAAEGRAADGSLTN